MSTIVAAYLDHRNNLREYVHQSEMFSKMLANRLLMLVYSKSSIFFPKTNGKLDFFFLFQYMRSNCENCLGYMDVK